MNLHPSLPSMKKAKGHGYLAPEIADVSQIALCSFPQHTRMLHVRLNMYLYLLYHELTPFMKANISYMEHACRIGKEPLL